MIILGIESTCDETAAAIVRDGKTILGQSIASSANLHALYGGVFPELACRRHIDAIIPVIASACKEAGVSFLEIDAIAVARGPGLIGALLIGLQAAKGLAIAWNKPLIGINHVEAHLYASMMDAEPPFPALGFVLSGGHTLMLKVSNIGSYELLSTTVDDAIGEAFDKVASQLGLPYPGGPHVESLAAVGDSKKYPFTLPQVKKSPLAFSFSGLKTAVANALQKIEGNSAEFPHIAASFQETAFGSLLQKASLAFDTGSYRSILLGGGVSNNRRLRELFRAGFPNTPIFWPPPGLSLDNAAMIAGLAHHRLQQKGPDPMDLDAVARLPFWIENS